MKYKKLSCLECLIEFEIKDNNRNKNRKFCSGLCAKRNNGKRNVGSKRSELWKEAQSKRNLGSNNPFFGKHHSAETKHQIGKLNSEKTRTIEFKEALRERMLTNNPFKGKHHTKESRKKMGRNMQGKNNPMFRRGDLLRGEKNGAWQGGISYGDYGSAFNENLKTEIRKRDKFVCAVCKKNGFVVHHIDYIKENNFEDNLITLCRSCHGKTGFNREYWKMYFHKIIMEFSNG